MTRWQNRALRRVHAIGGWWLERCWNAGVSPSWMSALVREGWRLLQAKTAAEACASCRTLRWKAQQALLDGPRGDPGGRTVSLRGETKANKINRNLPIHLKLLGSLKLNIWTVQAQHEHLNAGRAL